MIVALRVSNAIEFDPGLISIGKFQTKCWPFAVPSPKDPEASLWHARDARCSALVQTNLAGVKTLQRIDALFAHRRLALTCCCPDCNRGTLHGSARRILKSIVTQRLFETRFQHKEFSSA